MNRIDQLNFRRAEDICRTMKFYNTCVVDYVFNLLDEVLIKFSHRGQFRKKFSLVEVIVFYVCNCGYSVC